MPIEVITNSTPAAVTAESGLAGDAVEETPKPSASPEAKASETDETQEVSETSDQDVKEDSSAEQDDDADEEESEESLRDEKPKKRGGYKKRIDRLTRKLSAIEQEREYWRQEALKGQQAETPESKSVQSSADSAGKPKSEDYGTQEEWAEAVVDWKIDQRQNADAEKQKQASAQSEHQKTIQEHQSRVDAFKKETKDYDKVVNEALAYLGKDFEWSITLAKELISTENAPQLLYELAKEPEELERLNKLTPIKAARELGKIEARLQKATESPKEPKEFKKTKAPPPLKTVGAGSASVKKTIYDPGLTQAEYEELRADMRKRRA